MVFDKLIFDEVIFDEVIFDEVIFDEVIFDEVIFDEVSNSPLFLSSNERTLQRTNFCQKKSCIRLDFNRGRWVNGTRLA
jgi:hypothetical protein